MTRVALFAPSFVGRGGAEVLAIDHASYLREHGFGVELVALGGADGQAVNGFATRVMPPAAGPIARFARFARDRYGGEIAWAREAFAGFDTVIAHNFPASAALGAAGIEAQTVWYCHEPNRTRHLAEANPYASAALAARGVAGGEQALLRFRQMTRRWLAGQLGLNALGAERRFDVRSTARVDEIWANSEFCRDNAARVYRRGDVRVVYPMVHFAEEVPTRAGLRRGSLGILCVSRLEALKNVDTVVRGFARFREGPSGAGACLHLVGEGPRRADLERLAARLGVGGAVIFHGYLSVADLARVFAQCDVFALLPLDEPFGMVFPEAAARGLLLVGPDHGGPVEILGGGEFGKMVDALSPDALADALSALAAMSDVDADRLRGRALEACRARYGRDVIGRQIAARISGRRRPERDSSGGEKSALGSA